MTNETQEPKTELEIGNAALEISQRAERIQVRNQAEADAAGLYARECSTQAKRIEEFFAPLIRQASAVVDSLRNRRDQFVAPLKAAQTLAKNRAQRWANEEDERRRQAAEQAAEIQRQENERRAQEERDVAETLRDHGLAEAAQSAQALAEAIQSSPVAIAVAPATVAGLTRRKVWKVRVTDPSRVAAAFLIPDVDALRRRAVALDNAEAFRQECGEGVEAYQDDAGASR